MDLLHGFDMFTYVVFSLLNSIGLFEGITK